MVTLAEVASVLDQGSPAWTSGVFALLGVALGALLKWWLDRAARAEARRDARRLEVLDLVSGFLRDADTVWLGEQRLEHAVTLIQADPASPRGESERQAAFEEIRQPRRDALLAIGRMRIVVPEIVAPAVALLTASDKYNFEHRREQVDAREKAMRDLESAVTPFTRQ